MPQPAFGRPIPPGFHPFWFWNDRLTESEVRRQVREMASQGVRGFHIHPRQGLAQPYLSESFFAMVDAAVDEASRHGLAVHLYDEYPYPSGVAGGQVVLGNPRLQATRLVQRGYDVEGGPVRRELPRGRVLSCVAFPADGGSVRWDAPRDLLAHVGTVLPNESYAEMGLTAYNRKRYFASDPVPVLEVELPQGAYRLSVSVQAQVEEHKYWGRFADVLDPEAVSEFINLTHRRYAARYGTRCGADIVSFFADETAPGWSPVLPAAFRERYGEDLLPLLPALQDRAHPDHLRVAAAMWRLRYERFSATFERPLADWCHEHGLRYTGEKPVLRLAQLRYSDLPGCDAGHVKAGRPPDLLRASIRHNARAAASAAYCYGKEGALCECYHSLGWAATLQDAKWIAEGLALLGVQHLVPHAFFYSTHSLRKHDAPPTFFWQMPYWPLFHHLAQRMDRISAALAGTHPDASVVVVEPSSGLPDREDARTYEQLLQSLMARHVEFLLADTDVLEAAALADRRVRIRDVRAGMVVVPPMRLLEPPLAEWLARAEAAGVEIVRLPAEVEPPAGLRVCGRGAEAVWVSARRDGERRVWLLVNTAGAAAEVEVDAGVPLREVPLDPELPARLEGGRRRRLAPFESLLLEAGPGADARAPAVVPLALPARMAVRPDRDNLLRLGSWALTVDGDGPRTVPAMPVANQLAEGGFLLKPAVRVRFGQVPQVGLPPLRLRYAAGFECAYDGSVSLVMEPGSIGGRWRASVNEAPAFGEDDMRPTAAHVRGSLAVDITGALRPGRNTLTVEVETDRDDGGLRNPLYLAGGFGVAQGLTPPVTTASPFDLDAAGLRHYAGVVEYRGEWSPDAETLALLRSRREVLAELRLPPGCEDACEISLGGGPWRPALWSPRWIRLRPEEVGGGPTPIAVRLYTSLARAFEGERFDPLAHRYEPA